MHAISWGHVNPHTGLRYAYDPSVAIIELNNEDSLVGSAQQIPELRLLPIDPPSRDE